MPSKAEYWNGQKLAKITKDDIKADVLTDGNKQLDQTIRLTNLAFRIYHDSRKIVTNCTNSQVQQLMRKELQDSATDGWGSGVSDLEEAFEHLANHKGQWHDDNLKRYWAGPGRIGGLSKEYQALNIKVPEAVYQFLTSLNDKAQKLAKKSTEWQRASGTVIKTVKNNSINRVGTPAWKSLGDGLKKVDNAHDGMKSLLWLASVNEHSKWATSSASFGEVFGAVKKVRGAIETYDKAKTAGNSTLASGAMMALTEGLGAIPVLGKYYQEAFKLLPSVQAGFARIVQERNALAAKLGVDLRRR